MQKIAIKLGANVAIEISSESAKQLIEQAAFWSTLPTTCPKCGAGLVFFHRNPQDNDYWGQACTGQVRHEANFGVNKDPNKGTGLYYKGEWAEAYGAYQNDPQVSGQAPPPTQQPAPAPQQTTAPASPVTDPVAKNLMDMITSKQLGMIRAIGRETNVDEEAECQALFRCSIAELSKRGASDLISHLQGIQRMPSKAIPGQATQTPVTTPAQPPTPAQPAAQVPANPPPTPAPAVNPKNGHPFTCNCTECDDIPF